MSTHGQHESTRVSEAARPARDLGAAAPVALAHHLTLRSTPEVHLGLGRKFTVQGHAEVARGGLDALHLHPPFVVGALERAVGAENHRIGAGPASLREEFEPCVVGVLAGAAQRQRGRDSEPTRSRRPTWRPAGRGRASLSRSRRGARGSRRCRSFPSVSGTLPSVSHCWAKRPNSSPVHGPVRDGTYVPVSVRVRRLVAPVPYSPSRGWSEGPCWVASGSRDGPTRVAGVGSARRYGTRGTSTGCTAMLSTAISSAPCRQAITPTTAASIRRGRAQAKATKSGKAAIV